MNRLLVILALLSRGIISEMVVFACLQTHFKTGIYKLKRTEKGKRWRKRRCLTGLYFHEILKKKFKPNNGKLERGVTRILVTTNLCDEQILVFCFSHVSTHSKIFYHGSITRSFSKMQLAHRLKTFEWVPSAMTARRHKL